ncbi:MAG: protocatechuate 3,4-dioxygenase subunit beta [Hyphomicrobiales bacterium]
MADRPMLSNRDADWHPEAFTPAYRSSILRSPKQKLITLQQSAGDLFGPVFGHDVLGPLDGDLIKNFAKSGESPIGERILVHGYLLDEIGKGIPGALIEVWQANAGGRYRHKNDDYLAPLDPNFGGCGRVITDDNGYYSFRTIKPGPYPWPNGGNDWRPAHIHYSVFGSGFAQRLITQMYFEGDPHIKRCPIVNTIKDPAAIDQLTAKLDMEHTVPMDLRAYRLDVILRGPRSTLFENKLEGN